MVLSGATLPLPFLDQAVVLTNLAPPVTALLLGHALTDSMQKVNRVAQRSLPLIAGMRFAWLQIAALPVAIAMSSTVDPALYATVPAFVAVSAVLVAALGQWYWPPILVSTYAWIRFSQGESFHQKVDPSPVGLAALLLVSGLVYVGAASLRNR